MKTILTLALIYCHPRILLGMKKRGFGQGRWNGFGGKVKENEKIEEALIREVKEEANLQPEKFEKAAIIDFEFQGKSGILQVHLFKVFSFAGKPQESEEMRPKWFDVKEIPYEEMWSSDKYWLPVFLANEKFKAKFLFDSSDQVLNFRLERVKTI